VVKEHEGISNFKESRHNIWIQSKRYPGKMTWLNMQYCITTEEVQWVIVEWPDQWKVPMAINKVEGIMTVKKPRQHKNISYPTTHESTTEED
jgi:hypothetical protein